MVVIIVVGNQSNLDDNGDGSGAGAGAGTGAGTGGSHELVIIVKMVVVWKL